MLCKHIWLINRFNKIPATFIRIPLYLKIVEMPKCSLWTRRSNKIEVKNTKAVKQRVSFDYYYCLLRTERVLYAYNICVSCHIRSMLSVRTFYVTARNLFVSLTHGSVTLGVFSNFLCVINYNIIKLVDALMFHKHTS